MEEKELEMLRHSCAHVLAKAVNKIFADSKNAIGPAIDDGFYYDFDIKESITPEIFNKIEKEMKHIIAQNQEFKKVVVSRQQALEMFHDNLFKLDLITNMPEGE